MKPIEKILNTKIDLTLKEKKKIINEINTNKRFEKARQSTNKRFEKARQSTNKRFEKARQSASKRANIEGQSDNAIDFEKTKKMNINQRKDYYKNKFMKSLNKHPLDGEIQISVPKYIFNTYHSFLKFKYPIYADIVYKNKDKYIDLIERILLKHNINIMTFAMPVELQLMVLAFKDAMEYVKVKHIESALKNVQTSALKNVQTSALKKHINKRFEKTRQSTPNLDKLDEQELIDKMKQKLLNKRK